MTLSIRLTEPFSVINKKINFAMAEELNKRMRKNSRRSVNMFKLLIPNWIMEQPEVTSLLANGVPTSLNAQFGLSPGNAQEAVKEIVSAVATSMVVKFIPISPKLKGGVQFDFQSADFANLLGLGDGHQYTKLGVDLHWLDWLLTKGDTTIVKGYHYEPSSGGRSRGGTMKMTGYFRVPPEHAGTITDNFITRAFDNRERQISQVLSNLLR